MKAIILAGGFGTRLRSVVRNKPKPMAVVAGHPFLEFLIMQLSAARIKDIIVSVGYKADYIKKYFKAGARWGVRISYSTEDEPLGTAGAVKRALSTIRDEAVIVMNGDSFFAIDFKKMIAAHKKKKAKMTIAVKRCNDTRRYGFVVFDASGDVLAFTEKSKKSTGTINGGIYCIDAEVRRMIPVGNVSLEKEILPKLVNNGLYAFENEGFFVDIGTPRSLSELMRHPDGLLGALGLRIGKHVS